MGGGVAIEASMRSIKRADGIPMEEPKTFKQLKDYDRDAAGRICVTPLHEHISYPERNKATRRL
jgi:hypothetical protein